MKKAVFTIIAPNYLAQAKTLMDSLLLTNPQLDRYVFIIDRENKSSQKPDGNFETIYLDDILNPIISTMSFKYNMLEFCTSIKPVVFSYIFNKNYENVIYLDPDTKAYSEFKELYNLLDSHNIVLTPHLNGFLEDDKYPSELDIMRSGTYNLGFLGLKKSITTNNFLHWWQSKLQDHCLVDLEEGLFTDQKWIDLVPGIFEKTHILTHSGYNVAYWNLAHRKHTEVNEEHFFNAEELRFFHFSGFNPLNPAIFSKHQNRYQAKDLKEINSLVTDYKNNLLENGFNEYSSKEYPLGRFSSGLYIHDAIRVSYRENERIFNKIGNDPFKEENKFKNYNCNRNSSRPVTPIMYGIWSSNKSIQHSYPDIFDVNWEAYLTWLIQNFSSELKIPKEYMEPLLEFRKKIKHKTAKSKKVKIYQLLDKLGTASKPLINKIAGEKIKAKLRDHRRNLLNKTHSLMQLEKHIKEGSPKNDGCVDGVNLIGYLKAETGVGQSARNMANALYESTIPFRLLNIETSSQADSTYEKELEQTLLYNINISHINADQIHLVAHKYGESFYSGKYNIGFWHWELPEFPDRWLKSFSYIDEIWCPSSFIQQAISAKSKLPVVCIPHAISISANHLGRKYFNLPENTFLFLCMYDTLSYSERKNPASAIKSFMNSFDKNNLNAGLVIKINNSDVNNPELKKIHDLIGDYKNIYIINKNLRRNEVTGLLTEIDVYISLHRSEGYGLICAEAMALGKAVIATNWSGNVDFMNFKNSCPVSYELRAISSDIGPYNKGQLWAYPDELEASEYMIKLYSDKEFYREISINAMTSVKENLNTRVISSKIARRIQIIQNGNI